MVNYQSLVNKHAYYSMLPCLLGKHECKKLIRCAVFADNNYAVTERDYAEIFKAEFDMEI